MQKEKLENMLILQNELRKRYPMVQVVYGMGDYYQATGIICQLHLSQ
jgi:hypothetical protein